MTEFETIEYKGPPNIKLILGDCLTVMETMDDNSVDCVITDPPYGINYNSQRLNLKSGQIYSDIVGDKETMDFSVLFARPELKIIFGALNFYKQIPYKGLWLCWDKRTCEEADGALGSPFELAWISRHSGYDKIYRIMHGGFINSDGGKRCHPTQKPIRLFEKIITDFTKPSETILDPFMGSGTTGIACIRTGRAFFGIEIEPKYFEIAKQRIEKELSQPYLFEPQETVPPDTDNESLLFE